MFWRPEPALRPLKKFDETRSGEVTSKEENVAALKGYGDIRSLNAEEIFVGVGRGGDIL